MKRIAKIALLLLVAFAIGGFLVAASGVIPIKASSGHWAITGWLLQFSMARSVSTHSIGLRAPALDDPMLVLKGARHYETGCRPCHGSPEMPHPRIAAAMTPHPPYLPPRIAGWEPEELFYIVKHGVKFTGMPAWPAQQRDDEVWAMTAFLLVLPDLDVDEYRKAVGSSRVEASVIDGLGGPEAIPVAVRTTCGRCHGMDGEEDGNGAFPILAGQKPLYLSESLDAYARGDRFSGIMQPIAAGLHPDEIRRLADYYSQRAAPRPPSSNDRNADLELGATIARLGIPERGVPACADCHGPTDFPRNPVYPNLAGQHASYLILQLELFERQHRGGTPYVHLMRPVTHRLEPEQRRAVAHYYQSLAQRP